jgi:hypothetical protein
MAQDIRELFKDDKTQEKMPENHQERFLSKLEEALPAKKRTMFIWFQIAASVIILIGLSFGGFKYFQPEERINNVVANKVVETKTLGDVSPGLKKVEDYYLASINLELSKVKYTDENKDVFDGYIEQLNFLNTEYKNLSVELTENGPSELTVNALIDNLKYRLNLLYRLREQLTELNASDTAVKEASQSI